jgi:hypothetical protein
MLKAGYEAKGQRFETPRGTLRISILNLMDEDNPIDEISRIEARL